MNKKAEIDRLRPIVFEGAPDWAKWAAMDMDENWYLFADKPLLDKPTFQWLHTSVKTPDNNPCESIINFYKTELDWTETLIKR